MRLVTLLLSDQQFHAMPDLPEGTLALAHMLPDPPTPDDLRMAGLSAAYAVGRALQKIEEAQRNG